MPVRLGRCGGPAPDGLDTALCSGTVVKGEDTLALDFSRLTLEGNRLRCAPLALVLDAIWSYSEPSAAGATSSDTLAFR